MATTLAKTAFLKYDGYRPGIFLTKVKEGQQHLFADGTSSIVTGIQIGSKSARRIIKFTGNETGQWLEQIIRGDTGNPKQASNPRLVTGVDKDGELQTQPLGALVKTEEYLLNQVSYNKGNIAELLFSCAIVARFIKGGPITDRITAHDVRKVRNDCVRQGNNSHLKLKSPNKDTKIMDDLDFYYTISDNNWKAIKNDKLWDCWSKIVTASITYANSHHVADMIALVWGNGLYNGIKVMADGESDQTGTKVDVRVSVTDHNNKMIPNFLQAVSLKINGVKQFGQMGGREHDVQARLWKEAFDIDLKFSEREFNDMINSRYHLRDSAKAIYASYESAAPAVADKLATKRGIRSFASFVNQHATKGEQGVFIVDLKGDVPYKYDFTNLTSMLEGQTYKSEMSYSTARRAGGEIVNENLPIMTISIVEKGLSPKPLLAIRCKRGEKSAKGIPYYRNVFEKQEAFSKLFASAVEVEEELY